MVSTLDVLKAHEKVLLIVISFSLTGTTMSGINTFESIFRLKGWTLKYEQISLVVTVHVQVNINTEFEKHYKVNLFVPHHRYC